MVDITKLGEPVPGQWTKEVEAQATGTIRGPSTLFMHCEGGKASLKEGPNEGQTYEFGCLGLGGPGPMYVRCVKTGQWFVLGWEGLVGLAIAAGVSDAHPEMGDK